VGQLTSLDGLKDSSCRTQRNTKVQRSAPHTVAREWFWTTDTGLNTLSYQLVRNKQQPHSIA
jgi:hypothetical protein